jgi:two-component system, sensor histidine kinase
LIRVLGLALAYWGMAHLLSALATTPGFAAPIWPSAGIALGALVTWGFCLWPGVFIGSFVFNLAKTFAVADPLASFWTLAIPVGIAAAATLQGVLGAVLIRRFVGEPSGLEEPREIVNFLVVGGPVSCLVNASLSVALLVGAGVVAVDQTAINWLTWWAGDTIGVLVFAPLFLTVFGEPQHAWKPRRWTVALPLMLCLALITGLFAALQNWEARQPKLELAQHTDTLAHGLTLHLEQRGAEKLQPTPSAEALARQRAWQGWYRYALIIGSLLVISLIGTLLLVFTGRERHIALITDAVARVGRGDRTVRIPICHPNPLEKLEAGINEMASKIEQNKEQLERRVSQVTAELRTKKEESEAATLAKSRFLGYASHDLRQPLYALQLLVTHLTQLPLNYKTARIVGDVDSSIRMLTELLDGILDLSRLDSGAIKPTPQPVRVSELWQRVHRQFAETAAAKNLELRFRPSPLSIVTDSELLHRVLLNLVSNAIRYTSTGGVLVVCRRVGGHARLQVWDTGAGISPGHRQEMFKEFVQLGNTEGEHAEGLGLGLAIVERAAQMLGHRVRVRSVLGRGSCFSVDVPLAEACTFVTVPAEPPSVADSFSFAGFTALVIEDDVLARRALVGLLRSWSCAVLEATTAQDAQRLLARGCRPDVIASDFLLPGALNGIDFVRTARGTLGHDVPAFIISGDTQAAVIDAATAAGLPLLHKPVKPARLRRVLHLLLQPADTPVL